VLDGDALLREVLVRAGIVSEARLGPDPGEDSEEGGGGREQRLLARRGLGGYVGRRVGRHE